MMRHFVDVYNEHKRFVSTIALLSIALIGFSLALQGWRGRIPPSDMLPYFDAAQRLVSYGEIPDRGALTSYSSFAPPGPSWLILPGLLTFSDPRLFESIGSALLYFGTLAGIFLLARIYFGDACAFLSAGMYALSELGLEVGSSLYVRFSIHFFYIWVAYWAVQWVRRRNANYLAAAILTWFAGMYVYLEVAPALFIVPALWLIYRPPLRLLPLTIAGILALVMWYPYLKFEYTRNLVDLKSQVSRTRLLPLNYKDSWCDPTLVVKNWNDTDTSIEASKIGFQEDPMAAEMAESKVRLAGTYGLFAGLYSLLERAWQPKILVAGFVNVAPIPGASVMLLLLTVTSLVLFSFSGKPADPARPFFDSAGLRRRCLTPLAIAMILAAVVANELVAKQLSSDGVLDPHSVRVIRQLQTLLGLTGLLILARKRLWAFAGKLALVQSCARFRNNTQDTKPLVISLVVPWLMVFFLVEGNRGDRLWWLWPVQAIVLAAFFTYLLPRLGMPKLAVRLGLVLLVLVVVGNPLLIRRAHSWMQSGWSGSDPEEFRAIDYVAANIRAAGKNEAAIGYRIFIWSFMPGFNIIDSRYKVGADFDFIFRYRHHVANTNRCAEALSPNDQYRIVALRPTTDVAPAQKYISPSVNGDFNMARQFGVYQVLERN